MDISESRRASLTSISPIPDQEKTSGDGTAVESVESPRAIDPALEKRVLRKIDCFLLPAMLIGYGLMFYDKSILGTAALIGMADDLQLSVKDTSVSPPQVDTTRLSWATSMFYFGQLAGSYPMTYAVQHSETRRVLGPAVILWAIICASTAGVTTWKALFVQRFFLGFMESVIPTSFVTVVSGFYTQSEQALRQNLWLSAPAWSTIIGGSINYGFAHLPPGNLRPWQVIYIFAGGLTTLFGICCCFFPNSPVDAWFLTPEERLAAVERLRSGQTGIKNQTLKLEQVREAVVDVKLWLVVAMMTALYTINGAISGFGPIIISTFGYSPLESILLQFPTNGLAGILMVTTGWLASRYKNIRVLCLALCCLPTIAGLAIVWKSTWGYRPPVPVVGYTILGFFGPTVGLIVSLGASNVAGETKKSFTASAIFTAYCVSNIIAPQLVRSQQKEQHYPELWTAVIICYSLVVLLATTLAVILRRENKRRDALGLDESERSRLAFKDLTDKQNPYFRYVY